jgi:hypothetical protein
MTYLDLKEKKLPDPGILHLKQYFLKQLKLEWLGDIPRGAKWQMGMGISYKAAKHNTKPNTYRVELHTSIKPHDPSRKIGLSIEATIMGDFITPPGLSLKEKNEMALIQGLMVLWGTLRGEVASATGSFPSGKYILPTVNMVKVVQEIEGKKTVRKKTATTKTKKVSSRKTSAKRATSMREARSKKTAKTAVVKTTKKNKA